MITSTITLTRSSESLSATGSTSTSSSSSTCSPNLFSYPTNPTTGQNATTATVGATFSTSVLSSSSYGTGSVGGSSSGGNYTGPIMPTPTPAESNAMSTVAKMDGVWMIMIMVVGGGVLSLHCWW